MAELYPDLPRPRAGAVARDALTVLLLVTFAWLGLRVHHDVDRLSGLGNGVSAAGTSVRGALRTAGSAVSGVPFAGGALQSALDGVAHGTGGDIVALGRAGAQSAHHLATVLGLLMWGLPSLLLLVLVLPRRIREVRRLRATRLALRGQDAEARRRLLALRAVLTLPEPALFAVSADPVGDVLAGRSEALAALALRAEGLRAP